jgi:DNA primase
VWPAQNGGEGSYWCRQCGKGGDNIQFLRDFDGKSFQEACAIVGRQMDDFKPATGRSTFKPHINPWQPKKHQRPADQWCDKAEKMVSWCSKNLMSNSDLLGWLAGRGVSQEAALKYRLGWNPGRGKAKALFRQRKAWGLPAVLKPDGTEKKLWIPRGLVIPCLAENIPWRLRIRRPDADVTTGPRYYVLPGSAMQPLILKPKQQGFVIVESELDAFLIDQAAGDMVGVIALGNSSAKPDINAHKALSAADCILIALDFDQAGASAWRWWQEQYKGVKRWPVPEGKDPGEAFEAGVDIRSWLLAGLPLAWHIQSENHALNLVASKAKPKIIDDPAHGVERDGPVKDLFNLLKKHPVKIQNTEKRLRLVYSPSWSDDNWDALGEISDFVFLNGVVGEFLSEHPAKVITDNNFWEKNED